MHVSSINSLNQSQLFFIEKTGDAQIGMAGSTSVGCLINHHSKRVADSPLENRDFNKEMELTCRKALTPEAAAKSRRSWEQGGAGGFNSNTARHFGNKATCRTVIYGTPYRQVCLVFQVLIHTPSDDSDNI